MKSSTSSMMKTIGVGMLVGGATAILSGTMFGGKNKKYKKMAQKAIKTAEDFVDGWM